MINVIYLVLIGALALWIFLQFKRKSNSDNPFEIHGKLIWIDKGRITKPFYNNDFGVFGKPDFMYKIPSGIIAVEYKSRHGVIFDSDIVQAKAAALAARGNGYRVIGLVIKTSTTIQNHPLPLSDKELFDQISKYVAIARKAKTGTTVLANPSFPKCNGCAFKGRCIHAA